MALSYQHFTEEEDKMRNLIPDGKYRAQIKNVVLDKTKPGYDRDGKPKEIKDMLVFDLLVHDANGIPRMRKDWLLLEGQMAWKLRHAAKSAGVFEQYENKTLHQSMFANKWVMVEVKIKKGKDQNHNEVLRDSIVDYLEQTQDNAASLNNSEFNDEIPF